MGKQRLKARPPAPPRKRRKPPTVQHGDGQTFTSRHDEAALGNAVVGLVRQAMGLPSVWKFKRPTAAAVKEFRSLRGSTPNKRGLGRVWDYESARREGTPREAAEARDALLDFFDRQHTTEGLWWAETLTQTHGQLWELIDASARFFALRNEDGALMALTGKLYRQKRWLYSRLSYRGNIYAPGKRSAFPNDVVRDAVHALIRHLPIPINRKTGKPIPERWWSDVYNFGPWLVNELMWCGGDDLGGATIGLEDVPILRDRLEIHSQGEDFIAVFPHIAKATGPIIWWAGVWNGQPVSAPVHPKDVRNLVNPYPIPFELGGMTLTAVEGVGDGG